jgi:hypothetical protein
MAAKSVVKSHKKAGARIWRLESEKAFAEALKAEALHAVHVRYMGSRVAFEAIAREFGRLEETLGKQEPSLSSVQGSSSSVGDRGGG